jgi:hypothetical protein
MSSSYNTKEHIKNLIDELEQIMQDLKDCLIIIEYADNKVNIEDIRQRAKEAKQRAQRWM